MSSRPVLRATICALLIVATTAIALGATQASAEGRIEPLLEMLYAPDNQLVAGTLVDINPAGRLVFTRDEVLGGRGKPPAQIDVRVSASTLPTVKLGERYIFGYSAQRKDPRSPTRPSSIPMARCQRAARGAADRAGECSRRRQDLSAPDLGWQHRSHFR